MDSSREKSWSRRGLNNCFKSYLASILSHNWLQGRQLRKYCKRNITQLVGMRVMDIIGSKLDGELTQQIRMQICLLLEAPMRLDTDQTALTNSVISIKML